MTNRYLLESSIIHDETKRVEVTGIAAAVENALASSLLLPDIDGNAPATPLSEFLVDAHQGGYFFSGGM
jgi:hypothetical protein